MESRPDKETTFTTKGFVSSKAPEGNSSLPIDYSFTDGNNYPGISYHRLKQVDLDNSTWYSLTKAVKGEATVHVLIRPNPSEGQFSIRREGVNGCFGTGRSF